MLHSDDADDARDHNDLAQHHADHDALGHCHDIDHPALHTARPAVRFEDGVLPQYYVAADRLSTDLLDRPDANDVRRMLLGWWALQQPSPR